MGFSSALQGKSAHDALLSRQDAELRLLEIMKRCLLQKVKCDKEYAIALTAAAQNGLKIDRADDLQGKRLNSEMKWRKTEKKRISTHIISLYRRVPQNCQFTLVSVRTDLRFRCTRSPSKTFVHFHQPANYLDPKQNIPFSFFYCPLCFFFRSTFSYSNKILNDFFFFFRFLDMVAFLEDGCNHVWIVVLIQL